MNTLPYFYSLWNYDKLLKEVSSSNGNLLRDFKRLVKPYMNDEYRLYKYEIIRVDSSDGDDFMLQFDIVDTHNYYKFSYRDKEKVVLALKYELISFSGWKQET